MACNLYKIPSGLTPVSIIYTDCDGVDQPVSVPEGGDYYFCSTNLISATEAVEISPCSCDCHTVAAGSLSGLTYLDCNDTIISYGDVESVSPISFCAQVIISYPSAEVSKGLPCIYGECPTTRDILIQKLNSLRGPCPEVCDGSKKIGGVTGTDEINIITQNPL